MGESAVVETENIYDDLKNTALSAKKDPKNFDFNIINISTKYTKDGKEAIVVNDMSIFDDDNFFGYEKLDIKQKYSVQYYEVSTQKQAVMPQITIGTNRSFTKIIAKVHANKLVRYSDSFADDLTNEIYKKLAKHRLLLGVRNTSMIKAINKISSIVRVYNSLNEDFQFDVAVGIKPIASADDAMLFHYKEKHSEDETRKYLQTVAKDEIIIEYLKAKKGMAGRNLKGELIPVQEPKETNKQELQIGENIEIKEDASSIKYIAKVAGYVSEEGGKYDVKEELDVNEATIKTTGSIEAGLDSDVVINIREQDTFKDAVGADIKIETSVINIKGNVAQGAKIIARDVTIGGQTHAKSYVKADEAKIYVLLGTLECENADIERFEGGYVKAKKVHIKSAVGGRIIAEEVFIDNLFSNSHITAAKLVQIETLKGANNKIIIDVKSMTGYEEKISAYEDEKNEISQEILELRRELGQKKAIIEINNQSINSIKRRIREFNQMGSEAPSSFIEKLKDFQALVYEYNQLLKTYRASKVRMEKISEHIKEMQDVIFNSKVINKSRWKELNEIRFKLIDPRQDVVHNTRKNELSKLMMLHKIETSEKTIYEIIRSNELQ